METTLHTPTKTKWALDPVHSELSFKVKHLMITTVTGYFRNFSVEAITEDDVFSKLVSVKVVAETASIDTHSDQRDNHLKSDDFFNAEKYGQLIFESTKYEKAADEDRLYGNLTIRDKTRPVVLTVEPGGVVKDSYGQTKAGFTVDGKVNRKDFGLMWGAITEAGGVVVADEIKIHAEIQLIKQG
jgi:polyisoprenoid-binding protein YceI